MNTPFIKNAHSKLSGYDFNNIQFGTNPTDHMFIAEYKNGEWTNARIEPYHEITLSPVALCLHYGQTVFEGMKAYRLPDGDINIFRLDKHASRLNKSLDRLCMPTMPEDFFMDAIKDLVAVEQDWVPNRNDASLYLRPFVIATEARLGVKPADEYLFMIVCMPMASYYSANLKVKIETEFIRAAEGGTGFAKCGGNYGASFYPAQKAKEEGYDQVLWTDAVHREFIEESGTMNIMFIIDDVLVTPPLSSSILDGVTRDSLLTIAKDSGMQTQERRISYKELEAAFITGKKVEAFGVGTAAMISPIELISINGKEFRPYIADDATQFKLKQQLQQIRIDLTKDIHRWNHIIPAHQLVHENGMLNA